MDSEPTSADDMLAVAGLFRFPTQVSALFPIQAQRKAWELVLKYLPWEGEVYTLLIVRIWHSLSSAFPG